MRQTLGTGMMAPLSMANNFVGNYYAGPSGAAMGALSAANSIADGLMNMRARQDYNAQQAQVQAERDRARMDELNRRQAVAQAINPFKAAESSGMGNRDMSRRSMLPDADTQLTLFKVQEGRAQQEQEERAKNLSRLSTFWAINGGEQADPGGKQFMEKFGFNPYEYADPNVISRMQDKQADRDLRLQMSRDQQANARALAEIGRAAAGAAGGVKLSDVNTTRTAFMRDSGNFIAQRDGFTRVINGANEDNAVGDLKVIFGYMKLLDPTSVVREGEFANAENAQGVPDRVRNMYNKVMEGERLTPEQRSKFVESSYNEYKGAKSNHSNITKSYESLSRKYGVDPIDIIPDLYSETDMLWDQFNKPKPVNPMSPKPAQGGRPPLDSFQTGR